MKIKIKKGLNLPVRGKPSDEVAIASSSRVALIGADYPCMKPKFSVAVGDRVKMGQTLFVDKLDERIAFTSPASGIVREINRGDKRIFQSIEVEVDGSDEVRFNPISYISSSSRDSILSLLLESGLWTSMRARPYGRVADYKVRPSSIFITAIDKDPLAIDISVALRGRSSEIKQGLEILKLFTDKIFFCKEEGKDILVEGDEKVKIVDFSGKYPAGLVGTHIHHLDPVYGDKVVWYLDVQDLLAIATLVHTGRLDVVRYVAFGGENVAKPSIFSMRQGSDIEEIASGRLIAGTQSRLVSGSMLAGRKASGVYRFLGRYHKHISVIKDTDEREFMPWMVPGFRKYSILNIFLSKIMCDKTATFDTNINGSRRAMIPLGTYEEVFGLDLMVTQLLRAIVVGDVDEAISLGVLELEEEDMGLLTFVCHSKYDYNVLLRKLLNEMSVE